MECEVAQLCPALGSPMDCSMPVPPSMGVSTQEYCSGVPLPSLLSHIVSFHIYVIIFMHFVYLFIYFWLCWVFVAGRLFSIRRERSLRSSCNAQVSYGVASLQRSTGSEARGLQESQHMGSTVVVPGLWHTGLTVGVQGL